VPADDREETSGHLLARGDHASYFARSQSFEASSHSRPARWSSRPWRRPPRQFMACLPLSRNVPCQHCECRSMFATDVPPNFHHKTGHTVENAPLRHRFRLRSQWRERGAAAHTCKCRHMKSMGIQPWSTRKSFAAIRRSTRRTSPVSTVSAPNGGIPMDPCKALHKVQSGPCCLFARAARPALFERRAQARLALGKGARGPDDPRYRVRRRILSESLAQLGARVTAVDPGPPEYRGGARPRRQGRSFH